MACLEERTNSLQGIRILFIPEKIVAVWNSLFFLFVFWAFFMVAVVGMVASHPFSVEPSIFRTSAKPRDLTDRLDELNGLDTTIQYDVFELSPKATFKYPKKFDSLKDSSYVSKPISTLVKESESTRINNKSTGENEGLFRIPLYRQDLIPSSDQSRDNELRKVIIYSRDPYDVESYSSIPNNKDSASYTNTLKFIMDLLTREAVKDRSEDSASEAPNNEVSDPPQDVHSIYTPDGEFGQFRLTQKEDALLSSIIPTSS